MRHSIKFVSVVTEFDIFFFPSISCAVTVHLLYNQMLQRYECIAQT